MRYLSVGLFHQGKFFPVKFIGPNLFFPWLLVFYYFLLFNRCLCPCPLPRHLHHIHIIYLLFLNASSFTSPLPHFHYFLTVLLLSSLEETLSFLYHNYCIINTIMAEWFIRIAATTTTYSTAIPMVVVRISALMQCMLKRKK